MPPLETTLAPAQPEDVLELDELWSFVQCKASACWVWVALCRRTRQVVSWFAGACSADSCRQLWDGIPQAYRCAQTYSDFWQAYQRVFGENHQSVSKETGETAHIERWNNTLRQRLARFVRKSLSFSKNDRFHRRNLAVEIIKALPKKILMLIIVIHRRFKLPLIIPLCHYPNAVIL